MHLSFLSPVGDVQFFLERLIAPRPGGEQRPVVDEILGIAEVEHVVAARHRLHRLVGQQVVLAQQLPVRLHPTPGVI